MEWRPIESAPKDGTTIDLWRVRLEYGSAEHFDGERIADCWWGQPRYGDAEKEYDDTWVHRDGPWTEAVDMTSAAYRVTHWMPLPPPPSPSP